ncbi:FG-GAP-like repeat-containing protein [Planobispora siamensis]|uniref:Repeat domain-containing protein n=1 Tax=Planobispora siamensis TaxID=936338 RepID=A0A8J3SMZ7_9ACTN|nr:FG-GAP-like repeat-containing protein [Planobispora siamensis]GIH97418.1 hypothetical protein Psi01_80480 [Planobispora siamensis]
MNTSHPRRRAAARNRATGLLAAIALTSGGLAATAAPAQAAPLPGCAAIGFSPAPDTSLSDAPRMVVATKVNADATPDLVVSVWQPTGASVQVMIGNGDGTFDPPVTVHTGSGSASRFAVADFDGDAVNDLAVPDAGDQLLTILPGNGDGTFDSPVIGFASAVTMAVVPGDFDDDGDQDLLSIGGGSSTELLVGNGDGTFQMPVVAGPAAWSADILVRDFDGDGDDDVAYATSGPPTSNSVEVRLSNGDGTFAPAVSYPGDSYPEGLTAADFNRDGKTDLAFLVPSGGTAHVLTGNGDGTFAPAVAHTVGPDIDTVTSGDFNKDGKPDLVVLHDTFPGTLSLLLGNGDGTFKPPVPFNAGSGSGRVVAADFNGDGAPDLVIPRVTSHALSIVTTVCIPASTPPAVPPVKPNPTVKPKPTVEPKPAAKPKPVPAVNTKAKAKAKVQLKKIKKIKGGGVA